MLIGVAVFGWLAVRDSWSDVTATIRRLDALDVALAFVLGLAASAAAYFSWRSVLHTLTPVEMTPHDSRAMYFCSQTGKYVPGSVWPALIQTELGARNHIPRTAVIVSYALTLCITLTTAGLVSGLVLADARSVTLAIGAGGALAGGALLVFGLLHESGATRLVRWITTRRNRSADGNQPAIELHPRNAARGLLWAAAYWMVLGAQAVALALALSPTSLTARDALVVVGAFAFAWLCGFLALPLPAGAGIREAVFAFALGPMLGRPTAIGLALVTRFVAVLLDLGLAVVSGLPGIVRSIREKSAERAAAVTVSPGTEGELR